LDSRLSYPGAIILAFNKFAELQMVRQDHLWNRQERLLSLASA
jgi:hypothetical protein